MRPPRSPRRGALLLMAAFLILVLMGLAAVVVDLGIARVTQGWMQGAVDGASLEGLRARSAGDLERRRAAARLAALSVDGDLDLGAAPAGPELGLGPVLSTGVGGVDDPAGGLLELGGVYRPVLQTNHVDNEVYGDIVAGTYRGPDPALPDPDWHLERADYQRLDFEPAAATGAASAPSLLVRTRRTNDRLGLDRQEGVSSAGPTLPYLLGLGSGVLSTPDADVYDPRRDGITVRATAIADARPALAAGPSGPLGPGAAVVGREQDGEQRRLALALEDGAWRSEVPVGGVLEVLVSAGGVVSGDPAGSTPGLIGRLLPLVPLLRVGEAYPDPPTASPIDLVPATQLADLAYVGLYLPEASGPRVTGLAALRVEQAILAVDVDGNATVRLRAVKLPPLVAPANASAVPSLAADPASLLAEDGSRALLLAPVLAR